MKISLTTRIPDFRILRSNIAAKSKHLAKLFLPIHMVPRLSLFSQKIVENLVTLSH